MNTIILTSTIADQFGHISFKFDVARSELYSRTRRVTGRPTLDGGSVFDDYGFSHSDRTIVLVTSMNHEQLGAFNYIMETFSTVMASIVDGLYLARIQDSRVKGSEVTIKILLEEKLA